LAALEYKGHPLRRKDNIIFYGSFDDKYIIMLSILETKPGKDFSLASKVGVQLQLTDPSIKGKDRIVNRTVKNSLYEAMDIGAIWLERALGTK